MKLPTTDLANVRIACQLDINTYQDTADVVATEFFSLRRASKMRGRAKGINNCTSKLSERQTALDGQHLPTKTPAAMTPETSGTVRPSCLVSWSVIVSNNCIFAGWISGSKVCEQYVGNQTTTHMLNMERQMRGSNA